MSLNLYTIFKLYKGLKENNVKLESILVKSPEHLMQERQTKEACK